MSHAHFHKIKCESHICEIVLKLNLFTQNSTSDNASNNGKQISNKTFALKL